MKFRRFSAIFRKYPNFYGKSYRLRDLINTPVLFILLLVYLTSFTEYFIVKRKNWFYVARNIYTFSRKIYQIDRFKFKVIFAYAKPYTLYSDPEWVIHFKSIKFYWTIELSVVTLKQLVLTFFSLYFFSIQVYTFTINI